MRAALAGLHDKTITITTIHRMIQQGVAAINPFASRLGNVFAARDGLVHAQSGVLQAGVVRQPSVLFGERATGGEAFVPR